CPTRESSARVVMSDGRRHPPSKRHETPGTRIARGSFVSTFQDWPECESRVVEALLCTSRPRSVMRLRANHCIVVAFLSVGLVRCAEVVDTNGHGGPGLSGRGGVSGASGTGTGEGGTVGAFGGAAQGGGFSPSGGTPPS